MLDINDLVSFLVRNVSAPRITCSEVKTRNLVCQQASPFAELNFQCRHFPSVDFVAHGNQLRSVDIWRTPEKRNEMDSSWPATCVKPPSTNKVQNYNRFLGKRINCDKDVIHFKNKSLAYKHTLTYVNLLCEKINGTSNKTLNKKYQIQEDIFKKCSLLLDELAKLCDETDLSQAKGSAPLRFGHIAYRNWYDLMQMKCREFICEKLLPNGSANEQLAEELLCYLSESFGNKMRIDYGTGHELSFMVFTMGLSSLDIRPTDRGGDEEPHSSRVYKPVSQEGLKKFVDHFGWDILALFAHKYLRLCRQVQIKFRLEPAGSCGVYNMDDFQYLPFLFGAAQLNGVKYIGTEDFYIHENVDMYKDDFIFFEAVEFILNNKKGPFQEHSYTLWCFTDLGSWDNIFRRIKTKFTDDVLGPFPIVQHLMFGEYILKWEPGGDVQ